MITRRFATFALLMAGLLTATAGGQSPEYAGGAMARRMITGPIDEARLTVLAGNTHPAATAANDRGAVEATFPLAHMQLVLKRPPELEQALQHFMDEQQRKGSPFYHHWLTAAELGEQYGPAAADIDAVTEWLTGQGFQVNSVLPSGMAIDFSGNAGEVKAAFHTEIHKLEVNGEQHFANMSDPEIPAALAGVVAGVHALHNFMPHPMLKKRSQFTYVYDSDTEYAVAPGDLATIYNFNPAFQAGITGAGETVVVIEDTDIKNTSDVATFRSAFGLSGYTGTFTQVHPTGNVSCTDPGVNGDEIEAALDAEWAGAAAPDAAIELASCSDGTVFGGLAALENLLAAAHPPPIVSISYGECESENGSAANAQFVSTYQQAAAEGVSVFVSAGDEGAASCDYGATVATHGIAVSGYATTPYNVAVGGTDFEDTYNSLVGGSALSTYWSSSNTSDFASALSYIPEIPWNSSCAGALLYQVEGYSEGYGSGGFCNSTKAKNDGLRTVVAGSGGPSSYETAKPSWQSILNNPADNTRDIPDVSLFAANGLWGHYFEFCLTDTKEGGVPCDYNDATDAADLGAGGTSFSSPIFAGIQALINQSVGLTTSGWGNPDPMLYYLAQQEYGSTGSATCNSSRAGGAASSCVFYDVTQGDMDVNCTGTDCFGSTGSGGSAFQGVLSTSTTTLAPAYGTQIGWDFATGIGTVNVYNLIKAWVSPTTTSVASSMNPAGQGASVTFTATVATTFGPIAATGTVTWSGNTGCASSTIVSGSATCTTNSLPAGTDTVTATYQGDTSHAGSSGSVSEQVTAGDLTSTALSLQANSLVNGQSQLLTATVTDTENPGKTPVGTVTFIDTVGTTVNDLGPFAVNGSGMAQYSYTPGVGSHSVIAAFTPTDSNNFSPSNSTTGGNFTVAAYGALASFHVVVATSPVYVGVADSVTLTPLDAEDNVVADYAGPVTLSSSDAGAVFSSVSYASGIGTATVTFATVGTQTVKATSASPAASGTSVGVTVSPRPQFVVTVAGDDASGTAGNCPAGGPGGGSGTNCSLRDALAAAAGAGTGNISFSSSTFTGATTITLGSGGALSVPSNTTVQGLTAGGGAGLKNLITVSGNAASTVFAVSSGVTAAALNNLTITKGSGGSNNGGGIRNAGTLTVSECTLSNNSTNATGGGIANSGTLTLSDSTVSGNSGAHGGGVGNTGSMTVEYSTFTGNSASGSGGALYATGPSTVRDSTISGNSSATEGGIANSGTLTVTNSVLGGDTGGECSGSGCPSNGASGNFVGNGSTAADLSTLGSYGGPTQTMVPLPGSGAVCAGLQADIPGGVTADQRGFANEDTAYAGYSAGSPCVDAGAAQTNYSLAWGQEPSAVDAGVIMSPSPTVELEESGTAFFDGTDTVTIPLTLSGPGTLSGGSAASSAGSGFATYSALAVSLPGSGDSLKAELTVTASGVSQAATISATSTSFDVQGVAPAITSAASTIFTVGTAGTFSVTASGYPAPSFSETGALPNGVTLTANGTLAGTPAAGTGGIYPILITASNGVGTNATQNFTLTVDQAPAITSGGGTTFIVGTNGSFSVTGSGYPAPSFTETGALPRGVTLSSNGTLSGTPAAGSGGIYAIVITASNGVGANAEQNFTLTVHQAPAITSGGSTTFTVGTAGTFSVTGSGYPAPSFSETGALPNGVTLAANGTLSGTPAAGTGGIYSILITASNGVGTNATQNFTLTVDQAPAITSGGGTTFIVGTNGSFSVTGSGYPAPSFTETGALPGGVTLSSNGTLSGTPAAGAGGIYAIVITASNGVGVNAKQNFTLTVDEAPAITSADSTAFPDFVASSFTVTTGPGVYPVPGLSESGALPSGVAFHDNGDGTATLAGTPGAGAAGAYAITITAANGVGTGAAQSFTLTVNPPPTYVVTTATDDAAGNAGNCAAGGGSCSLRDALAASASIPGNISFSPAVFAGATTIQLGSGGTLHLGSHTTITGATAGSGASLTNLITVAGGGTGSDFSVLAVSSGVTAATIKNLNITGGTISDTGGEGAGIQNFGSLTIESSIIAGNQVTGTGGVGSGIYNAGTLTMIDCTVSGNAGPAIYNDGTSSAASFTSIGSTIAGNSGASQAIMNIAQASLTLKNTTVAENTGGGLYVSADGTLTVSNSILASDSGGECSGQCPANGANGNIVDAAGTAAKLAALGHYGGPAETLLPMPGSAAICAGSAANIAGGVTTDERGLANTNTTYMGYSAETPCVDAGAVQTNYTIGFSTQPAGATSTQAGTGYVNEGLSPAPVVQLSESGMAVSISGASISMAAAAGTLSGATAEGTNGAGAATFGDLSFAGTESDDTLRAALALTAGGVTPAASVSATSDAFNVIYPVTAFTITAIPSTVTAGAQFSYTVTAYRGTSVANNYTGTVSFTTSSTQFGFTSSSYTFTPGDAGVHVFTNNASLNTAGEQTLTVTDASENVSATSSQILVTAAAAYTIAPTGGTGQSATIGAAFAHALGVKVEDSYGNPVSGAAVTFMAPATGASANLLGGGSTDSSGSSSVTATANALAGGYTVTASVTGVSAAASFALTNTQATPTVALTVSPASPIPYGQAQTTLQATVSYSIGTPTGNVTFTNNNGALGAAVALTAGAGSWPAQFLNAGSYSFAANYAGDANYIAASSAAQSYTVNKASSTLSGPTQQPVQVAYAAAGTVPIAVAGQYSGTGIAVPTGSVGYTLTNSSGTTVASGSATLTGAAGSAPIASTLAPGFYTMTVTYGGDANYSAALNLAVSVEVGQIQPAINWTQPSPIVYGTNLSGVLTAAAMNGAATVPGSYTYTATPAGGSASTVTAGSVPAAGSYTLNVIFTPTDTTTYKSATGSVALTVNKAVPGIALTVSQNPALAENAVTLTATVSSGASTPTGSVTFYNGTAALGAALPLNGGVATLGTSALPIGSDSITAVYSGDTNFVSGTSNAVAETIEDFSLAISGSSGNSDSVAAGATATYNLVVSPVSPAATFPAAINLSVSGIPAGASYTITPQTLSAGAGATSVTLSITTENSIASRNEQMMRLGRRMAPLTLALLLLPFARRMRRAGRRLMTVLLLAASAMAMAGVSGCSSGGSFKSTTPPTGQTYTVLVTGTSGNLSHSLSLTLTVE